MPDDLEGTIRVNGVLMPMMPYGCHSANSPDRFKDPLISNGHRVWPHRMSTKCRYDRKDSDERCAGCLNNWDAEYVENLK